MISTRSQLGVAGLVLLLVLIAAVVMSTRENSDDNKVHEQPCSEYVQGSAAYEDCWDFIYRYQESHNS